MTTEDLVAVQSFGEGCQQIVPAVQNYDWGKIGADSLVAIFAQPYVGKPIVPELPYAEVQLYMFCSFFPLNLAIVMDGNSCQRSMSPS